MKVGIKAFVYLLALLLPAVCLGQFVRMDSVSFQENNQSLHNPFAGGLNQPQFSSMDLNGDLLMDLVVFDRTGNKLTTFINSGALDSISYSYAPAYQVSFPQLHNWALFRDFDCDGKADIFTGAKGQNIIQVYRNTSTPGQISFQLLTSALQADGIDIFTPATDIPAVDDIDGDGDLDLLSFDSGGFNVQYFRNTGGCNNLTLTLETACWGQFEEDPFTNDIYLNSACKTDGRGESGALHSGSTLTTFDVEGDSAKELLLGDLNFSNLVYLHNGGSSAFAEMDQVIAQYPDSSIPVSIFLFPASYLLDVNNDQLEDLIVAPNASNISANFNASWYYENTGDSSRFSFALRQSDFLQDEMVDCGSDSHPVSFDYNADGLQDLVIGNLRYKDTQGNETTALTLYENIGSATQPAYKLVSRDYLQISSLFSPPILGAFPAFGDLDEDGDEDLLLGDLEGRVHFFRNEAGAGNPAAFTLFQPVFAGIDVGQNASPQIIDINRDGRPDLLIGEKSGNLNYYPNSGVIGQPDFSTGSTNSFGGVDVTPQCCGGFSVPFLFENTDGDYELVVGSEGGALYWYGNIDGNLEGTFILLSDSLGEINEGIYSSPHAVDLDKDNKLEWLVGNGRGGIAIYEDTTTLSVGLEPTLSAHSNIRLLDNPGDSPVLRFDEASPTFKVEVFSLVGERIVHQEMSLDPHHVQLRVPKANPGVYLIRVSSRDRSPQVLKWVLR